MGVFFRAKAPLRLGLGGGGTDIIDYSSRFGGAVINATISSYAHATIEPLDNGKIELCSRDRDINTVQQADQHLGLDDKQLILIGTYNRIVRDFVKAPLSFRLTTHVDAPPGSGLGSSSTLVVAIIGAFCEWLKIPLGRYEIANLAYEIEREDLNISGGKQDQFAATFGGFNFMEFNRDGTVMVNPLPVKNEIINELEHNLLLLYTSRSRYSADIIDSQKHYVQQGAVDRIQALHEVKKLAYDVKNGILKGNLEEVGRALYHGWESKKRSSDRISNDRLDSIILEALAAGALGGKISGAGGGGFMMLYCPGNTRYGVINALRTHNANFKIFKFVNHGLVTWSSK